MTKRTDILNCSINRYLYLIIVLTGIYQPALLGAIKNNNPTPSNNHYISFSSGSHFLLPSLVNNTHTSYEIENIYSDLWVSWSKRITESIEYSGSIELANLPQEVVGTNYSRSDYLLTTGRFQEGGIKYSGNNLVFRAGRLYFFDENERPEIFINPSSGDGFSWTYEFKGWQFKHVMETLRAERSSGLNFRRLLNYHHLRFHYGPISFGAAEYFILTGTNISLDLKRFNPFLPYTANIHDSLDDWYPGYEGDADNSIINFFSAWNSGQLSIILSLYIDELQIDSWDRDIHNDAILFNILGNFTPESLWYGNQSNFLATVSISNPNFGEHPGPITTATNGIFPLFETSIGIKELYYTNISIKNPKRLIGISYHWEKWVNIKSLSPGDRNLKSLLRTLDNQTDSAVKFYFRYTGIKKASFGFEIWNQKYLSSSIGVNFQLTYNY
jgi:hypothetical protein